jgi:hypothetical protein
LVHLSKSFYFDGIFLLLLLTLKILRETTNNLNLNNLITENKKNKQEGYLYKSETSAYFLQFVKNNNNITGSIQEFEIKDLKEDINKYSVVGFIEENNISMTLEGTNTLFSQEITLTGIINKDENQLNIEDNGILKEWISLIVIIIIKKY